MKIAVIPVTPFQQNCSIIRCERTQEARVVEEKGLQLKKILLTHAHLDHCAGTAELARRFAIVGDVLFANCIGRSDFPGGNHEQLLHSIRDNLFPLDDDVTFLPGHGPTGRAGGLLSY